MCLGDRASQPRAVRTPRFDRDAHFSRCGVKIAVRQSGIFSELLPRHSRQTTESLSTTSAALASCLGAAGDQDRRQSRRSETMPEDNVIRFATAQEKRQAEEQLLSAGAELRQKILAGTIEALRQCGFSKEEIAQTLRFGLDVLEGRER